MSVPTFKSIVRDVDSVKAQLDNVRAVLRQLDNTNPEIVKEIRESLQTLMSRLEYHVDHAINYAAYNEDKLEAAIAKIIEEHSLTTKVALACIYTNAYGHTIDMIYIDPADVKRISLGGIVNLSDGEEQCYCKVLLKDKSVCRILGTVEEVGDFLNFLTDEGDEDDEINIQ